VISAAVDAPVVVGSQVAVPRGAEASLRIAGMDDGITLRLSTVSLGSRHYNVTADTYHEVDKPKKHMLGRVGGLVHKKHGDGEVTVIEPESRLTFTLQAPLVVTP
jgi:hypothetical protein